MQSTGRSAILDAVMFSKPAHFLTTDLALSSRKRTWIALAITISAFQPLAAQPASSGNQATCPALLQHTYPRLQDEKPQPLCQYTGMVIVVVNTASFCGFTPQYAALEALHTRYRLRGLAVLGFPSNDFSQETGSNKQIAEFCENTFGVKFPMFAKTNVRGPAAAALFKNLAARSGRSPNWNFHKYIVGRDGTSVVSFSSETDPAGRAFVAEIEKQLGR